MARTPSTPEASARPRRTPLSVRNRLSVKNKEAGYVYRVVNDIDDRVSQLQEQGYELVEKAALGAVGDKRVDNTTSIGSIAHFSVGQGMKAVVMRQKLDYYNEDRAIKEQQIDEIDAAMQQEARKAGDYIPSKV
jgi:hypothetical protein